MAQWIKQNDTPSIVVGPFVANTDGFTPVTDAVASDFDTFEAIKHGSTDVTAMDTDQAFGAILGFDGFYHLSLTGDETDTLGLLTIGMQDNDAFLPVRHDFMVVSAGAYGAQITGTDAFAADISGIPTTNLDSSDIQAELVTYDALKGTEGAWASDVAALNNLASSDIQAELVTYDAATGTEIAAIPTTNLDSSDIAAELVAYAALKSTDGAWASDVAAVSASIAATDIADIADAVWDEVTTDHVGAGTFGLNIDSQVSLIPTTNLDSSDIQAELVTYDAATGTELAALNNLADTDILGYTLETGYTVAQALKLIASASAGKVSGGGTATIVFRDLADGADRITATVDTDGNRTAVTHNA